MNDFGEVTVTVTVPEPIDTIADKQWTFEGVWDCDYVGVEGLPEQTPDPAVVALSLIEGSSPYGEAHTWLSPDTARQLAGALVAAAEYARGGRDEQLR